MDRFYAYSLRPVTDNFGELLLEFQVNNSHTEFILDLTKALGSMGAQVVSTEDVWMNDEMLLAIQSDQGEFQLSIDVWDNAFILAKKIPYVFWLSIRNYPTVLTSKKHLINSYSPYNIRDCNPLPYWKIIE